MDVGSSNTSGNYCLTGGFYDGEKEDRGSGGRNILTAFKKTGDGKKDKPVEHPEGQER